MFGVVLGSIGAGTEHNDSHALHLVDEGDVLIELLVRLEQIFVYLRGRERRGEWRGLHNVGGARSPIRRNFSL